MVTPLFCPVQPRCGPVDFVERSLDLFGQVMTPNLVLAHRPSRRVSQLYEDAHVVSVFFGVS